MVLQQHVCSCVGCACAPLLQRSTGTSKEKKLPEKGLDRLKHVGVVGIILTK